MSLIKGLRFRRPGGSSSASTFSVTTSKQSGAVGDVVITTVAPIGGTWPTSQPIIGTYSGSGGSFSAASVVAGSSSAVSFLGTITTAGSGMINATIAGMTSTGGQTYTAVPGSTFSGIAPRFDAIAASPVVAPGSTVTFGLYPHAGNWPNSGSITASTGIAGDSVTTANMAGGTGALSVTVTAGSTPGQRVVTFSNTGSIRNPAPRRLNVFAASSGSAATLSPGTAPNFVYDQGGFQLQSWAGSWGWTAQGGATFIGGAFARVGVNPSTSVTALFGRLHDGWSTGANSTAGTGTQISNVVQISGPRSSGDQVIAVHVPGVDTACYLDVSATSDMANAIRIPLRFTVRDQWFDDSRSRECQTGGCYPYGGPPGSTAYCAYQRVTGAWNQNPGAGLIELLNGGFGRHDGTTTWGQYGMSYGGVAGSETGRIFAVRKGLGLTMTGTQEAGGNTDDHWQSNGAANSGQLYALNALDGPRYVHINCSNMTGSGTLAAQTTLIQNIINWIHANWPSVAVIVIDAGVSGQFGSDGSSQGINSQAGYTRVQRWITANIETVDPTVISADMGSDWNEYDGNSGHASYRSAIRYAQKNAECALMAESPIAGGFGFNMADRGATFSTTASMAAGSGIIRLTPILPAGATKLKAQSFPNGPLNGSFVYTDATADMSQLVAVYQGANKTAEYNPSSSDHGADFDASGATLGIVPVSAVTIDTNGDVLIHVPTSTAGALTVHMLADFYRNGTNFTTATVGTIFHDGRDLGLGIGRGPGARSQLDIQVPA